MQFTIKPVVQTDGKLRYDLNYSKKNYSWIRYAYSSWLLLYYSFHLFIVYCYVAHFVEKMSHDHCPVKLNFNL